MKRIDIELNPDTDNMIDATDLGTEFREFPPKLFRYSEKKSDAERDHDLAKNRYEEVRAQVYLEIKRGGEKVTEKHLDALIEVDVRVQGAFVTMVQAKRDLETLKNFVDSLRAKKDMLIQLGADARKE
jgi:hypothetical protein